MKSNAFYAVLGIGILLVMGIIWWGAAHKVKAPTVQNAQQSDQGTTTPPLTGMSIYTNGEYGFSVMYPGIDTATTTFASYYHLPNSWRIGASPYATGTPLLTIIGYQTKSDSSYPRYFDTEVRIGASADPREQKVCMQIGDGEAPLKPVQINGTTWGAYAFQGAGMMQYVKGISYRTLHNGTCFAVEQVETGSSYRDDSHSNKDIPDSVLDQHYQELAPIVKTFSFVKP